MSLVSQNGPMADPSNDLDPMNFGHVQVQQSEIGLQVENQIDGLGAIGNLSQDFQVRPGSAKSCNAFANDSMVVGKHEGNLFGCNVSILFLAKRGCFTTTDCSAFPPRWRYQLKAPASALACSRIESKPIPFPRGTP